MRCAANKLYDILNLLKNGLEIRNERETPGYANRPAKQNETVFLQSNAAKFSASVTYRALYFIEA